MSLTTDVDLMKMAKKLNIKINAIVYKDQLKQIKPVYGSYIINMSNSNNQGTHWIALYISKIKGALVQSDAYYFDSFGCESPTEIIDFVKRAGISELTMSNIQIQSMASGYCGWFCANFLAFMNRNTHLKCEERYRLFLNQFKQTF